ncbi:MAG: hypothetical protein ACI8PB_002744 [Desulforhopalus sp.]|jgi:hypothetical protein
MTDINNNEETSPPRSRTKKGSNSVLYLFIVTIIALIGGFYFYQKNIDTFHQLDASEYGAPITQNDTSGALSKNETLETSINQTSSQLENKTSTSTQPGVSPTENFSPSNVLPTSENNSTQLQLHSEDPQTTEIILTKESAESADYNSLIKELDNFYTHLDAQQYMQNFTLEESSKNHFSKLIQKLIDNPPIVARETDDLFTLLKNTAHFFRVIGKDNILILKGILDREKNSFETILQSFYQLTYKPEYLQKAYSISLDTDALYDYAGFFLNTMGGRLYLFRRDSNSRMAVSFYAILIIDRANNSGNSRHGIDIRPAVDSLIEEIENGGKNLQLRDSYLDTLYDLKEKYS